MVESCPILITANYGKNHPLRQAIRPLQKKIEPLNFQSEAGVFQYGPCVLLAMLYYIKNKEWRA